MEQDKKKGFLKKAVGAFTSGLPGAGTTSKVVGGVRNYLKKNKDAMNFAKSEMTKKYPSGWAQSQTNVSELQGIMKKYKKDNK